MSRGGRGDTRQTIAASNSMQTTPNIFIPELILDVLSHYSLHNLDDAKALASCIRASPLLRALSRSITLRSIVLSSQRSQSSSTFSYTYQEFHQIVCKDREEARFVHEVEVDLSDIEWKALEIGRLADILGAMVSLRKVTISLKGAIPSEDVLKILASVVAQRTVRVLQFHMWDFSSGNVTERERHLFYKALLSEASGVKDLEIYERSGRRSARNGREGQFDNKTSVPDSESFLSNCLEISSLKLFMDHAECSKSFIVSHFKTLVYQYSVSTSLSQLTSFSLVICGNFQSVLMVKFLHLTKHTLRHLSFYWHSIWKRDPQPIHFHNSDILLPLSHLQTLQLSVICTQENWSEPHEISTLPEFAALLESLPQTFPKSSELQSQSQFEFKQKIKVFINIRLNSFPNYWKSFVKDINWVGLAGILTWENELHDLYLNIDLDNVLRPEFNEAAIEVTRLVHEAFSERTKTSSKSVLPRVEVRCALSTKQESMDREDIGRLLREAYDGSIWQSYRLGNTRIVSQSRKVGKGITLVKFA